MNSTEYPKTHGFQPIPNGNGQLLPLLTTKIRETLQWEDFSSEWESTFVEIQSIFLEENEDNGVPKNLQAVLQIQDNKVVFSVITDLKRFAIAMKQEMSWISKQTAVNGAKFDTTRAKTEHAARIQLELAWILVRNGFQIDKCDTIGERFDEINVIPRHYIPLGKPKKYQTLDSSRYFSLLVSEQCQEFASATKNNKTIIINQIENRLLQEGYVFVQWETTSKTWVPSSGRVTIKNKLAYSTSKKTGEGIAPSVTNLSSDADEDSVATITSTTSVADFERDSFARGKSSFVHSTKVSNKHQAAESVSYFSLFDGTEEDTLKMEKLREIVESDEGLALLLRCANNKSDPSVIHINNAMEIFLDGNTKGYMSLRKLYSKEDKHLFIPPSELVKLMTKSIKNKYGQLHDYSNKSPALLYGYKPMRGPQVIHCDAPMPPDGPPEMFGIFMFSKDAPGTIYHDMSHVQDYPSIQDIVQQLWTDCPPETADNLIALVNGCEQSKSYLQKFGRVLYGLPKTNQVNPGMVDQFSMLALNAGDPHFAPACDKRRLVGFVVFEPPGFMSDPYDGKTQCSKEKLCLLLYESLLGTYGDDLREETKGYILGRQVEYHKESNAVGAWDETISTGDEKLDRFLDKLKESGASHYQAKQWQQEEDKRITLLQQQSREKVLKAADMEDDWGKKFINAFIGLDLMHPPNDP
jgi:hypothetical protein